MVRTAPNELSFNSAQSWKDIYGFRPGHETFVKSNFYDGGSFAGRGVHSIVSERDVEAHGQMRKYLSHAFSDRSLSEQEELVAASVVKFVDLAGERGRRKGGWDIAKAYEMMTFDIIGDLAFGETFNGLEDGAFPLPPPPFLRCDLMCNDNRQATPMDRYRHGCLNAGCASRYVQAFP